MFLIAFVAIIGVYLAITIGVTYGLTKFGKSAGAKWTIGLASFLTFIALAIGDEVWGYVYLRHLCETEGGIKTYRTVTLGDEHWNNDGSPKFISFSGGESFKPFLDGRYQISGTGKTITRWPEIVRRARAVVDRETKDQLAAHIYFSAGRGWLLSAPGWHAGGRSCPAAIDNVDRALITSAFRRQVAR